MKIILTILFFFTACQTAETVSCEEQLRDARLTCVDALQQCSERLALCLECPEGVDCD